MQIRTEQFYDALDKIYTIGDRFDNNEGGVKALTDGAYSTRDLTKLDLVRFLLHLISENKLVTQTQADVLSIVVEEDWEPDVILKKAQDRKERPSFDELFSLIAFLIEDVAITKTKGEITTDSTKLLLMLYRMFGELMLLAGDSGTTRTVGTLKMDLYLGHMARFSREWIANAVKDS